MEGVCARQDIVLCLSAHPSSEGQPNSAAERKYPEAATSGNHIVVVGSEGTLLGMM